MPLVAIEMKKRELLKLGFPHGPLLDKTLRACGEAANTGLTKKELRQLLKDLIRSPRAFVDHPVFGPVATELIGPDPLERSYRLRQDVEYPCWGDDIDPAAHQQMRNACRLPITVAGALMPDAHVGYGLPIGGVLATDNAVIPYAVGVDIACRVKVTVFDQPAEELDRQPQVFERILKTQTVFGVGRGWPKPPEHPVLDEDWNITPVTRQVKDLACKQIGSSGSGNHFVEFGEIQVPDDTLGIPPGRYVAVVSHSGSRGAGNRVASHYSRIARELHPNLPRELAHLAWLPLDRAEGAEYWAAMELMGRYAHANHEIIHDKIIAALGQPVLFGIENHHNFAWKEKYAGRDVIVHRKGATPAAKGQLGYIPGSMTAPGYVVLGLGNSASINSASHGAGRKMSRRQARETTRWSHLRAYLEQQGVRLLSAGLDESPHAYKDIDEVMNAQAALVRPVARFKPRIVRMAPEGERPED